MFKNYTPIATSALLALILTPSVSHARQNRITGGLSISYDYNDRRYSSIRDNPDTATDESQLTADRDDDYRRIVLTPLVHFKSISEKDTFELRATPGIKYDLIDYGTDWDNNLYIAADRFVTKSWQLGASNHFLRSDYHNTDNTFSTESSGPSQEVTPSTDPQLSTDNGRRRYWRNTFNIFSDYIYQEDSLFSMGFNYIVLRNDDTGIGGYEDYDRYAVTLRNEHRFSSIWKSNLDLQFVRGNFDPADREIVEAVIDELAPDAGFTPTDDQLSKDLKEYHLLLTVDNESIAHNPLFLSYNYIGSQYDEALQDDGNVHQMRFTWKREFSPQLYTKLGGGPSYEKSEGRDANWGGNGIAELDYQMEHSSFNFLIDKRYDVNNFSGNDERGFVDIWDSRLSFNHLLQRDLSMNAFLSYIYEDREELAINLEDENLTTGLEVIHKDRYIAGLGLTYSFMQYYSAGVNYTFTKQESDRIGDTYDDHRLLLTLSWQKELARW
ncbi:MAG: hypothetical protein KAI39_06010 [Desulfobulbaceae bacterium]|nr:hypothetical protein [Desulfobulbaceae bacterium]